MTIERLEELHTLTREMAKEMIDLGRWKDEAVDFSFDICQLIEAEIDKTRFSTKRMKFEHTDTLKILWGDEIETARPASGWDGITTDPDKIRVILEGDTSHNPVTIDKSRIISVNGDETRAEAESH